MFTALMSLVLVATVVAAAVHFSLTMDEMLSHGVRRPVQSAARLPAAGVAGPAALISVDGA